jgi:hypothetical protein
LDVARVDIGAWEFESKGTNMSDIIELDYQYDFFSEPDPIMGVALGPHDGKHPRHTVREVMRGARADSYPNLDSE